MASSTAKEEPDDEEGTLRPNAGTSSPKELQKAIYAQCASYDENHVFDQEELLGFNIIPQNDVQHLATIMRQLAKDSLVKVMTKDGKACWKVIKKADTAKYKSLSQEEALVYSYIESSGRDGVWSKLLRAKTGLHLSVENHALKALESKNMIKSIKSVKYPSRKTYMVAKLQPSEDVTGGPFHTDGVLDEEFVYHMAAWAERYIIGRSWWFPPQPEVLKRKSNSVMPQEQAEQMREAALRQRKLMRERETTVLPYSAAYDGYPTIAEITRAINKSGLSGVTLKESEMGQLLDTLRWDGRIEEVPNKKAFRAVRLVSGENGVTLENGLTESPCGRCPVFDLCEEDGPVNARTCEYFQAWLQI